MNAPQDKSQQVYEMWYRLKCKMCGDWIFMPKARITLEIVPCSLCGNQIQLYDLEKKGRLYARR